MMLDCYEYCSDAYKKELDGPRAAAAAADERAVAASRTSKADVSPLTQQKQNMTACLL